MTLQKRQRLMLVVLFGSVIFGLVMKPWERRRPVVVVPQGETPVVEAATAPTTLTIVAVDYVAEWPSRDPFKQASQNMPAPSISISEEVSFDTPSFALQGIMTVGGEMACVIDGATRTVGASIAGWRVEKIEAQGVWVSQGGERHYVPLQ